jgi:hypothetical protein
MSNIICWICNDNFSFKDYKEAKLLDENGNKPCLECILESETLSPEEEEQ